MTRVSERPPFTSSIIVSTPEFAAGAAFLAGAGGGAVFGCCAAATERPAMVTQTASPFLIHFPPVFLLSNYDRQVLRVRNAVHGQLDRLVAGRHVRHDHVELVE